MVCILSENPWLSFTCNGHICWKKKKHFIFSTHYKTMLAENCQFQYFRWQCTIYKCIPWDSQCNYRINDLFVQDHRCHIQYISLDIDSCLLELLTKICFKLHANRFWQMFLFSFVPFISCGMVAWLTQKIVQIWWVNKLWLDTEK